MTRTLVLLLGLSGSMVARAQPDDDAARQIHERLAAEWQTIVDAETSFGWQLQINGRRFEGDWVVRLAGWTYLFARGTVRCRIQTGQYISCDDADFVETPAMIRTGAPRVATFAVLRLLHRGVFGSGGISVGADGTAVIETIVSTPPAAQRSSRRYRANATLTTRGFGVDAPRLVEAYRERCTSVHGCHAVHWTCTRVR